MELKRYCQQRRWKNAQFYIDRIGGYKASRPELDRLVGDLRAGKVERLIVYKLDRLGRSLTHLSLLLDEMDRLGIPLICTSQGIDTSDDNPCAKFQIDVLKAVAEFERNLIKERVHSGLAAARARGVKLGRPGTLDRHTKEIRQLKRQGLGVRAIGRKLRLPPSSVCKVLKKSSA
jgi:DNA invertase Pin-like site-specific DNA recombinase